ncbi:hypothetical protein A0H81_10068 [Grifola frondosa]|uniref:Glycogen debranching enzyme C-terminal domain-containing protein n=1 Tax=Grifola frondosa TaxID=5627 RepID=A0A1C7M4G3_GRIFR|nr:hypothetical protein A0H81_10068 [Grifola frondosa]
MQMKDERFNTDTGVDWNIGIIFGGNEHNCGTWMDKLGESVRACMKGVPDTPQDRAPVEVTGLLKNPTDDPKYNVNPILVPSGNTSDYSRLRSAKPENKGHSQGFKPNNNYSNGSRPEKRPAPFKQRVPNADEFPVLASNISPVRRPSSGPDLFWPAVAQALPPPRLSSPPSYNYMLANVSSLVNMKWYLGVSHASVIVRQLFASITVIPMTIAPQHTLMRALDTEGPSGRIPKFLMHASGQAIVRAYPNATLFVQSVGKLLLLIHQLRPGREHLRNTSSRPGTALVFVLPDSVLLEVEPSSTVTFATAALTKTVNTVTIDASVLATFNGENDNAALPEPDRAEVPVAPQDAYASVHPGDPLDSAMLLGFLHNRHTVDLPQRYGPSAQD